jgi:hypothetical protein
LSEQNNAGMVTLFGIQRAVLIGVKGAANEFNRDGTMPVGKRFGVDVRPFAEFEGELSDASVVVVPVFKPAEESYDQRRSRRDRGWRGQVRELLCPQQGTAQNRRKYWPLPQHKLNSLYRTRRKTG